MLQHRLDPLAGRFVAAHHDDALAGADNRLGAADRAVDNYRRRLVDFRLELLLDRHRKSVHLDDDQPVVDPGDDTVVAIEGFARGIDRRQRREQNIRNLGELARRVDQLAAHVGKILGARPAHGVTLVAVGHDQFRGQPADETEAENANFFRHDSSPVGRC
jgi:hypothetical protein